MRKHPPVADYDSKQTNISKRIIDLLVLAGNRHMKIFIVIIIV